MRAISRHITRRKLGRNCYETTLQPDLQSKVQYSRLQVVPFTRATSPPPTLVRQELKHVVVVVDKHHSVRTVSAPDAGMADRYRAVSRPLLRNISGQSDGFI